MSDNENGDTGKAQGGKTQPWTEHEVLVYVLRAMEHSNLKIDFANAPMPVGRNASGCAQKINKMKNALRAEMDALKAVEPLPAAGEGAPKKTATPRKRKVKTEDENGNANGGPKKRRPGRPKKNKVETEELELELEQEQEPEQEEVYIKSEMRADDEEEVEPEV